MPRHLYQRRSAVFQQDAGLGLQDIDDHFDQGFRGKEDTVVLSDILGKLVEEIFVDVADHVAAHIVQGAVVEYP